MKFISRIKYGLEREILGLKLAYNISMLSITDEDKKRIKYLNNLNNLETRAGRLFLEYCDEIKPVDCGSNILDIRAHVLKRNLRNWIDENIKHG